MIQRDNIETVKMNEFNEFDLDMSLTRKSNLNDSGVKTKGVFEQRRKIIFHRSGLDHLPVVKSHQC